MTRSDSADTGYTSVVDPITSRIRHGRYDVSMYDPKCLSKRNCTWTCREGGLGSKEKLISGGCGIVRRVRGQCPSEIWIKNMH